MKGQPGPLGWAQSALTPQPAHTSGRWGQTDTPSWPWGGGNGGQAGRHRQSTGRARVSQRWSGALGRGVKLVNSA